MSDPAWVALSLAEHVGGKKLRALLAHFGGDPNNILSAERSELQRVPGIGPKIAAIIRALRPHDFEQLLPRWEAAGVRICPWYAADYPARLLTLPDPPPTLFMRGSARGTLGRAVAVVGTRQPAPASLDFAHRLGHWLAAQDIVVVSGLALGIDRAAHLGALSAPLGYTVAVLGSGVLNPYPPANVMLAEALLARGLLLSEVHPSAQPSPASLVARNRLISGLSDALVVVETGSDGGAMHAARRAWEQGRPVYALDNGASGNVALIQAGARSLAADFSGFAL